MVMVDLVVHQDHPVLPGPHQDHPVLPGPHQDQDLLTPLATPQVEATVDILEQLSSLTVATLLPPTHIREIPATTPVTTTLAIELKTPSPRLPKDS